MNILFVYSYTLQNFPKRGCYGAKCNGEVCRILHDPELSPPHHWLATYKYIADASDVVIHFGAEGALEYLPGKRTALSDECFPEISIGDLPNLYVYVMDNPGEGLMAKRRGRAVIIDHLTPVYRPSELDEQTQQVQELLEQYFRASEMSEQRRLSEIKKRLEPLLKQLKWIDEDHPHEDFEASIHIIARQIELSKRTLAAERMHILGTRPNPDDMASMLATIARYDSRLEPASVLSLGIDAQEDWRRHTTDKIAESEREIEQLLKALDGGYIEPGLGGSLLRGKLDALPSGRNFYATDITILPTPAAWEIGKNLADRLLQKYLHDEGRFPEHVGISLWSSDAFKSDGEVLSQIFYLLGTRPVWDRQGKVNHVEVIPLEELMLEQENTPGASEKPGNQKFRRPRIDVTVQTSGIVRDMVPNFCELLDEAVVRVSALEEPEQWNAVRKHVKERMQELSCELDQKLTTTRMQRMATLRVFSSMPGTYGLGVGLALDASAWNNEKDLAEVYVNWGGYAYGSAYADAQFNIPEQAGHSSVNGLEAHRLLAGQLATLDVAYMKQFSAEYDVLDCGGYAVFQGGMAAASQALGGKQPKLYWGDSTTPDDPDVRDLTQEIERSIRAKLLNRRWIEVVKQQGFQGAQTVSSQINNLFKWSAASRQIEKRLFDAIVETYLVDEENLRWLRQTNPYALEEITRRMLESHARGLWDADPKLLVNVQAAALEIEGDMEDTMGEIEEDFQGNTVEILTADDVEKWIPKFRLT